MRRLIFGALCFLFLNSATAENEQCPKPHQKFSSCGSACEPSCNEPSPLICTLQCVQGCVCEKGYLQDGQGNCVSPSECPNRNSSTPSATQCTKENEEFHECGTACETTCKDGKPKACTLQLQCVAGCFCKTGFVRSDHGDCVLEKDCPKEQNNNTNPFTTQCSKTNEEFHECGTACPPTCSKPHPTVCTKNCVVGCACKSGFLKNDKGECVLPKDCPPASNQECTKPNQEFRTCGTACEPSCKDVHSTEPRICTLQCIQGCFCKRDFVLDDQGNCINETECPDTRRLTTPANPASCKRLHEKFDYCGSRCEPTCTDPNPSFCTADCAQGCFCEPGYLKNEHDVCVLPEDCPPLNATVVIQPRSDIPPPPGPGGLLGLCTRPNQIFKTCGSVCAPSCENTNPEPCTVNCVPGCFCVDGYGYERHGNCVNLTEYAECTGNVSISRSTPLKPPNECNKPHQKFNDCGTACESTCLNPSPPICSKECNRGCFCEVGFLKTHEGDCVLPKDCPQLNLTDVTPAPSQGGLLALCTRPNQKFKTCGSACPPSCDDPNPGICTEHCVPGCFCDEGYGYDKTGNCVKLTECSTVNTDRTASTSAPQCGDNEIYSTCKSVCPRTCEQPHVKACVRKCGGSGCVCKDGYVLDSNDHCVLPENCPGSAKKCGDKEQWSNSRCVSLRYCQYPNCPNNPPRACPRWCLKGGCICKDGLMRNKNGACVAPEDCEK